MLIYTCQFTDVAYFVHYYAHCVCVCICACMCTCTYVCMAVYVFVCACVSMCNLLLYNLRKCVVMFWHHYITVTFLHR